ncbi:MAG: ORF6N domain-containing protein [Saprospirales bacterium]|nr:ORF6N domain-containing protein [Saprospirales bacterium]MBK8921639.1 ORF6N domain-containing protein [Saprospirales bacterium]
MELQLIRQKIHEIRGQKVILDFDLADLYEVPTKVLKQAVRRNIDRFPSDFMFELTWEEYRAIRSQIVTLEKGKGKFIKYVPYVFTEHGVAMLSGILNTPKAIQVNIAIFRAFVALRHFALTYAELSEKIAELETRFEREFADVHEVLRWLGKENQARADEIAAMQTENPRFDEWQNRARIGFKKEMGNAND